MSGSRDAEGVFESVGRRGFLELTGAVGLAAVSGSAAAQSVEEPAEDVEVYGLLIGPKSRRPSRDGPYLAQYDTYRLAYFDPNTGKKWHITHTCDGWDRMVTEFTGPENQVAEVKTASYTSQFNHTFARPNEPSSVRWNKSNVTSESPEVVLTGTASLSSKERGNYASGSEAIPGVAFRLTGAPGSNEDATAGYYTSSDGFGFGRDNTSSYVFIRKPDGSETVVRRSDWNGTEPPNFDNFESHIRVCRFEHLYYGGGAIEMQMVGFDGDDQGSLYTVHRFTAENLGIKKPPFGQPNLPAAFDTDSLTPELRATAAHYEKGEQESDARFLGEHATRSSIDTSDWYHVVSWKKKSGYDMLNIKPLFINAFAESTNIKMEIQQNASLGDGNGGSPTFSEMTHADTSESPVEWVTGDSATINTDGDRRWAGHAPSGQGASPGGRMLTQLIENLDAGDTVTLAAQAYSGTGSLFVIPAQEAFY